MKQFKLGRVCALVLAIAFALSPARPDAQTASSSVELRAAEAQACFLKTLRESSDAVGERGPGIEIFLAEHLARNIRFDESTKTYVGPLMQLSTQQFCDEYLVRPFFAALAESRAEIAKKRPSLAPIGGTAAWAPAFLRTYQGLIGKHYDGHFQITGQALESAAVTKSFTQDVRELIQAASQTPDVYRWEDLRYHAHTGTYDPDNIAQRRQGIADGQRNFSALLVVLVEEFRKLLVAGAVSEAAFLLGMMSHLVQDLEFHRGMTLSQHAGLAYVVDRDPDFPQGELGLERSLRAVANTAWILEECSRVVSPRHWEELASWRISGSFDLRALAERVYGLRGGSAKPDMTATSLFNYRLMATAYRLGLRPRDELEARACSSDRGLACWDVPAVIDGIRGRLREMNRK